ncbi:DUF7601 domain-containing protein [Lysinibacillus sp. NPDC047702]|uniref:DUF7601 domain-containing protein n=1 Tax=unclassified Lysinibacillus TaxID=2636778 RepID=UPI003CFF1C2A
MKRKRSISKSVMSFLLVVMLILQTLAFAVPASAESSISPDNYVEDETVDAGNEGEPVDTDKATGSEGEPVDTDKAAGSEGEPVDTGKTTGNEGESVDTGKETDNEGEPVDTDKATNNEVEADPSAKDAVSDTQKSVIPMSLGVPTDKTAVFMGANTSFPLEVKQGNAVIDPNGTIQGRQQFTLKSEGLATPVNGDDPNPTNADPEKYIQKGDWIELKREDYFKEVVLPTATKVLNAQTESGMKQLGTAYFTPNSIKIVFNGDDNFFNGVGRGIVFSFDTTADADVSGMAYGELKPINIFGTAYQLNNTDVTAAYSITLSSPRMIKWDQYSYRGLEAAQFVEGAVTWQSTVSAFDQFDKTIQLPLDGKTFYTNPETYANVKGIYVPGSFKVNGVEATPDIGGDGALSYIFPVGTGENPQVEYKVWIPKEGYYFEYKNPPSNLGRSYRVMLGKAELRQDSTKLVEAGQELSFAPDWIQASASYDHSSETITWRVTVNQYNKKGLKNFIITNVLPAGLEFTSATWNTWVDGAASGEVSITPDANSVYSFGDINGKVELVIKSKVTSGSSFRIDPRANWNLDTPGGIQDNDVMTGVRSAAVTDEAIVTIGAHTFTKGGTVSQADFNRGGITWTVNLTPQYALPNAAVYDVLVHGGDLNVLNNAVDATGEVSAETIAKIKANINTAQLWKQYDKDTLKSTNGLSLKAIPLTVNGEVVADLIKVTGYTDQTATFSFRSLETNPDFLFKLNRDTDKTKWNRALLFEGETYLTYAQISVNLHLRMLNKDMLFASKPLKVDGTPENVNPNNISSYISNDSNEAWTISAYDRTTKTVTFRLGVNMPGYNTEEMAKDGGSRVISNIKLVDTLPEGWEFVPFSVGKDYELWKGYSDNGSGTSYGILNNAVSIIEPYNPAHVVSFSHSGNVGTFNFSKLESPYVILVKARPSNAALEKYLEEYSTIGTTKQVLFNKADLHMTWGGAEKVLTEQRKVIVPIQTLGKSVNKPVPGVLEWTVNYTPPFNMEQGVYLQDTIGAGMNLRYETNGKLVLTTPSMAVYRAKLTASGALERDGAALDLSNPNTEVQVEATPGEGGTTVLKFKLNDPNQFYQFVYQTEVDTTKAKAGDKMGNEVKLAGDDKLGSISAKSESTLDSSDVAGSSSSNALLPLKKVDPDGKPLQGVQFTLYKKDDGTQVAKGTTDSGGKLNLLFPDPGYYELKETYIDTNTWLPTTRIYQVYVGNTPGKPIWVDGVKVTSDNPLVVPTPATGGLIINNTVTGNGGDRNKEFNYTIIFDGKDENAEYEYVRDGVKTTIKSGDSIILKHGEAITFPKLLEGLSYTVTQESYQDGGYTTDPESRVYSGAIEKNKVTELKYVNNRTIHGQLLIDNTVTGSGSNKNKDFEYTVTFTGEGSDKSYSYTKSDDTTGTIESGQKIVLKHGEAITVHNLPVGLTYTIQQIDYTNEEYTTTPEDFIITGSIEEGKTAEAHYINNREMPGGLLISNTVTGNGSDEEKEFEYTVIFTGAGADKTYDYTKSDGTKGQIKSGDKFHLKHEQTLLIEEILKDTTYVVTEKDYTAEGYTTTPTSREYTGTIKDNETAKAPFENVRYLPGTLALEPKIQKVRGDGKTPVDLTATLTGQDGKPVVGEEVVFIVDGVEVGKAITDENGKATISYTPPKLTDVAPKEHKVIAKTDATSPSGVPYNEDDAVVITMPAALTGVLRDNETRKVLPYKEIVVKNVATGEEETITTDSEGRYYHLVQQGEEYTITYKHPVTIGGVQTLVPFTQKAIIEGTDNPIEGNLVPAEITAVGIVLFKQPNGTNSLLTKEFAGKLNVYLKDAAGNYVSENGAPKAFPLEENGTFTAEGLTTGNYTLEVRYEFEPGKELILVKDKVLNLANIDELNISAELVDPYGTVYDKTTGDENTGKKIEGATVTLYYADTPRNRAKGITPGTKVVLPAIPGFAPNDNASPEQYSDIFGFYAYMVFPEADYYLVVTKNGYETYTSPTISVEFDIVQHNVPMKPVSPGGSGEGNPGTGGNPGGSENNPGTGGNPGDSGNNPGTGGNPGDSGNKPGTGGNPGDSGNKPGTGGNPGDSGNNPGTGGNPGDSGNNPGTGGNPGDSGNNPGTGGNPGDSGNNPGTGGNPGDSGNNPGAEGNPGDSGNNLGSVGNQGDSGNNPGSGSNSEVSGNKLNSGDKTESSRNSKFDDNNSGVNKENKLDNVPKTGDNSMPPIFYMALALMSLIMLGFLLFGNKKKKHI